MFSDHIKIRADIQSCQYLTANRIKVKLLDPLAHLIDSKLNFDELTKYETRNEANLDLLKKVKTEFFYSNRKLSTESVDDIAKPITNKMKSFKPALYSTSISLYSCRLYMFHKKIVKPSSLLKFSWKIFIKPGGVTLLFRTS